MCPGGMVSDAGETAIMKSLTARFAEAVLPVPPLVELTWHRFIVHGSWRSANLREQPERTLRIRFSGCTKVILRWGQFTTTKSDRQDRTESRLRMKSAKIRLLVFRVLTMLSAAVGAQVSCLFAVSGCFRFPSPIPSFQSDKLP